MENRSIKVLLILALVLLVVSLTGGIIMMVVGISGGSFSSNGERIYATGTSDRDDISFSGGPAWFQMHDGGCAVCHGPNGKGGRVPMGRFTAPDIRYSRLTKPHDDEPALDDEGIKRAITEGEDSDGKELSGNMPRWDMSDEDLNDLIEYLKQLN